MKSSYLENFEGQRVTKCYQDAKGFLLHAIMVHTTNSSTAMLVASSSISQRYSAIKSMVVDYALGVAIIGLNPFRSWLLLTIGVATIVILKMIWDIRRKWRFAGKHHGLAIASYGFNLLGALAMGFMALLTFVFIGVFFSRYDSLCPIRRTDDRDVDCRGCNEPIFLKRVFKH